MKTSTQGRAEMTGYEGVCTAAYIDSGGVWTFGIGHTRFDNLDPNPETMPKGVDHPLEEIFDLFSRSIVKYEDTVNRVVTRPITQSQFDALVSFHYNTGKLSSSTLLKRVNAGASAESIENAFGMWNKDNGRIVSGLVRRRKYEADMFNYKTYSQKGMATVTTADRFGKEHGAKLMNVLPYIK